MGEESIYPLFHCIGEQSLIWSLFNVHLRELFLWDTLTWKWYFSPFLVFYPWNSSSFLLIWKPVSHKCSIYVSFSAQMAINHYWAPCSNVTSSPEFLPVSWWQSQSCPSLCFTPDFIYKKKLLLRSLINMKTPVSKEGKLHIKKDYHLSWCLTAFSWLSTWSILSRY